MTPEELKLATELFIHNSNNDDGRTEAQIARWSIATARLFYKAVNEVTVV